MAEDAAIAAPSPGLRKSFTIDESSRVRSRPLTARLATEHEHLNPDFKRRSSNFSDFSLNEARRQFQESTDDLLLPKPSATSRHVAAPVSHWHSAPLAFALLPALGGMFFKNGSSIVTDIMLLALAAVFLNWSVRLPWDWYTSAQEIRKKEEYNGSMSIDDEDDGQEDGVQDETALEASQASMDGVDGTDDVAPRTPTKAPKGHGGHESAANELYVHELLALLSCFVFPMLGAFLLHTIRSSLSRPSEGLVSDYNLTIFLLASEIRPMAHLVKLIQARTLHLQRIVASNPYDTPEGEDVNANPELLRRLENLEGRMVASPSTSSVPQIPPEPLANGKQTAVITTEVRRSMQPELESLNRAVRRYEKRLATQTMQTESRLLDLEARLADAISLAAAATHSQRPGLSSLLVEWILAAMVVPLQLVGALVSLPFKTMMALIGFGKSQVLRVAPAEKGRRGPTTRPVAHGRLGPDRLQSKGLKR